MYYKNSSRRGIIKLLLSVFITLIIISASISHVYAADSVLDEAKGLVKNYYVEQVPDSVLDSATTMEELVKSLGDPHSMYFTADEYQSFIGSINNSFVGIGIRIEMKAEGVSVVSIFEGSPAQEVGLRPGDIITEADGHSLAGLSSDAAVAYIKGAEGTKVHIIVYRDGGTLTFDILRKAITAPTVEGKMLDGGEAYIMLSSFGENTAAEFKSKLEMLDKNNPQSYIIDLRDDPGGYLVTALNMAGFFLGNQPALLTRDRSGQQDTYFGSNKVNVIDKPVIFLINGNSASASEILTAAVKDYKKAFIIGTRSYGKGTVQSMFELSDGGVLKLTVQKFFSPLGNAINKVGITPDIDTGDVDALTVSELLLGKTNGSDKTGYLKYEKDGRSFEIDLNMAKKPEYWKAFKKIMDSRQTGGKLLSGTKDGWVSLSSDQGNDLTDIYFPGYKGLSDVKDVPTDKKFTVKFNANVDASSLGVDDIELINAETGERTALKFENIDSRSIRSIPQKPLESGKKYYIVIHNTIKGSRGQNLPEGAAAVVNVK